MNTALLTVKRKGQYVSLTGFYQPHKFVPFSLEIDIESIDIASTTLDSIRRNNKTHYNNKESGYFNHHDSRRGNVWVPRKKINKN